MRPKMVKDLKFLFSSSCFDGGEEHRQIADTILDLFNSKVSKQLGKPDLKPGDAFVLKNVKLERARPTANGFYIFDMGYGFDLLGHNNTSVSIFLGMIYRSTDMDGYYSYFELLWLHRGRFYFYERPVRVSQLEHKIEKENFVFWNWEDFVSSVEARTRVWESIL